MLPTHGAQSKEVAGLGILRYPYRHALIGVVPHQSNDLVDPMYVRPVTAAGEGVEPLITGGVDGTHQGRSP